MRNIIEFGVLFMRPAAFCLLNSFSCQSANRRCAQYGQEVDPPDLNVEIVPLSIHYLYTLSVFIIPKLPFFLVWSGCLVWIVFSCGASKGDLKTTYYSVAISQRWLPSLHATHMNYINLYPNRIRVCYIL